MYHKKAFSILDFFSEVDKVDGGNFKFDVFLLFLAKVRWRMG